MNLLNMNFPHDLYYYKDKNSHIWFTAPDKNGILKVGMDAFLLKNAGVITYLTVDDKTLGRGDAVGSFESAKFVSRYYSPLSGTIKEVNKKVLDNPGLLSKDPYDAWIFKMKPTDWASEIKSKTVLKEPKDVKKWIMDEIKAIDGE